MWGFGTPIQQQKEKSLSLANNVPAGCMNRRSLWALYFPPSHPCTSTIAIQVPNCTHAACCWSVHMTNYFWAYYQKSALARGSGWGEGERKRGALGIQTKPAEALQTKERDTFLPLLTSKKNSFQLKMAAAWKQQRAPQRSPGVRTCVCLCVYLDSGLQYFFTYLFLVQRNV